MVGLREDIEGAPGASPAGWKPLETLDSKSHPAGSPESLC